MRSSPSAPSPGRCARAGATCAPRSAVPSRGRVRKPRPQVRPPPRASRSQRMAASPPELTRALDRSPSATSWPSRGRLSPAAPQHPPERLDEEGLILGLAEVLARGDLTEGDDREQGQERERRGGAVGE